jgi:hypothetical protein
LSDKRRPAPLAMQRSSTEDSNASSASSIKAPRTPRFAEATTVYSPVEPSDQGRSPFADPPQPKTQFHMPQSQPSDIGFGYIADNGPSRYSQGVPVEIPLSPASPLKSAMKIPGTPGRKIDNPLSPTFREEQILEKHEQSTEKEQAQDLVSIRALNMFISYANSFIESQDKGSSCQGLSSWCQLQLQSYRLGYGLNNSSRLFRNESFSTQERPSSLGQWYQDVATNNRARHFLHISRILYWNLLRLLERWS